VEVRIHAGAEDGNAAQLIYACTCRLVAKVTANQQVETRIGALACSGDEVWTVNGTKLRTDKDACPLRRI